MLECCGVISITGFFLETNIMDTGSTAISKGMDLILSWGDPVISRWFSCVLVTLDQACY